MEKIAGNASDIHETIALLKSEVEELRYKVTWLEQENSLYRERLRLANLKIYGRSSEKTSAILDNTEQLTFEDIFNEAEKESDLDKPEPELTIITYKRKKRQGQREEDYSGLPTEQITYELPAERQLCPECGGALHACGHKVARRELDVIPAQYKVLEHVETVYACRRCENTSDHTPMVKAPVPAPIIPNSGILSPGMMTEISYNKYALALPLYRQEQDFRRAGLHITRQNMANWVIKVYETWIKPLVVLLHVLMIQRDRLQADETVIRVLHEKKSRCYMWLYRTCANDPRAIVIYDYHASRAGVCAADFLDGFKGYLHTDGYPGYHAKLLADIIIVGCWAHMRRYFADTLKAIDSDLRDMSPAKVGLDYCNRLFILEALYNGKTADGKDDPNKKKLSPQERYEERLKRSKPIAEEFFQWVKDTQAKNPLLKGKLGDALTYAIGQQAWLMNVFLDGNLELSNNDAERSIRPFTIGRKNWLFCNTPNGALASAGMYTIVETAKANGLNPRKFFRYLYDKLPQGVPPEECLPWLEAVQIACR